MGQSNTSTVRPALVDIFGRSQSQSQSVNEGANGDELSYSQYEDGNRTEIMEEESKENEAEEESQVGEASDGNGNQISVIHDENQQIELAGHPSVGMYYASINVLFDAYLSYVREKGFNVAKKSASEGNGNLHKYQTISCDREKKSYAESISKRINCPARLSLILRSS
ncbi:hypothetical protein GH714_011932 [Hevea brasiliensis]|uniref:FAR1 domain-containing protein n=1 Tax=Hevea brasiliensis TaxID=3981 RepID=A0A6A6M4Q9_HEVBR|nr:hypothetical protein GH714_011932 [Hevea brasiliensis]